MHESGTTVYRVGQQPPLGRRVWVKTRAGVHEMDWPTEAIAEARRKLGFLWVDDGLHEVGYVLLFHATASYHLAFELIIRFRDQMGEAWDKPGVIEISRERVLEWVVNELWRANDDMSRKLRKKQKGGI